MMVLRKWYRWLPAMVLVAVLSVLPALPARAMPLDLGLKVAGWWTWVAQQVGAAWMKAGTDLVVEGSSLDAGAGIDPTGAPVEAGSSIDPAGAPLEAGGNIVAEG